MEIVEKKQICIFLNYKQQVNQSQYFFVSKSFMVSLLYLACINICHQVERRVFICAQPKAGCRFELFSLYQLKLYHTIKWQDFDFSFYCQIYSYLLQLIISVLSFFKCSTKFQSIFIYLNVNGLIFYSSELFEDITQLLVHQKEIGNQKRRMIAQADYSNIGQEVLQVLKFSNKWLKKLVDTKIKIQLNFMNLIDQDKNVFRFIKWFSIFTEINPPLIKQKMSYDKNFESKSAIGKRSNNKCTQILAKSHQFRR
ncbi:unnamed protein product [Paramecium octaurelia]|uniref:Uncharacterized protein n=1 Tax=Paramecium octaurelia TaxID=43137 RepID=A0A8S1YM03_PAROT|nr:unnamed protein product [Paramecium octaurelia]